MIKYSMGQTYDDAANMSSAYKGAQAYILKSSHWLNSFTAARIV